MLLPDTAEIRSRARRVDAEADVLTDRSRRLRTTAAQAQWVSLAATRFRDQVDELGNGLDVVVANLRQAARELRAHADSVDRLVHAALALPAEGLHAGEQAAEDGVQRVRSLLGI